MIKPELKPKFKEGDRCRVIANYFSYAFDCMIGKIVTIDRVSDSRSSNRDIFYYIKEKYWYIEEDVDEPELLNIFEERELELIKDINPKKLLLSKIV